MAGIFWRPISTQELVALCGAVLQHRLDNMVRFWTDKNQRIRVQHILHARFFSGYDPAMTILRMTDDSDAMAML